MADTPWKNFERYIATIFNSVRNSLSGGNSKMTRSDSLHPKLFISCKYTRFNHKGLRQLLAEEREKAAKENKLAVLVIGEFDDRANAIVTLHLKDIHKFCEEVRNGSVKTALVSPEKRAKSIRT
jgi:hypothetical protein